MKTAEKLAKITEVFKAYSVTWECNNGHKNFQTIIDDPSKTQLDVCLRCGEHYQYKVDYKKSELNEIEKQ